MIIGYFKEKINMPNKYQNDKNGIGIKNVLNLFLSLTGKF